MRAIENGAIGRLGLGGLYDLAVNPVLQLLMRDIITNWSIATGRNMKDPLRRQSTLPVLTESIRSQPGLVNGSEQSFVFRSVCRVEPMPLRPNEAAEDWLSPFEVNESPEPQVLELFESPWAQGLTETGEFQSAPESDSETVYLSEEEDTESPGCCSDHDSETAETEAEQAFEADSEDFAVDELTFNELETEFENEAIFDEAEAVAWEMDWREEEAPAARVFGAGSTTIEKVPLLRNHAGIGPDVILAWNEINGAPASVDVVLHLHGYSLSPGARLHITRDLKKRSGLDWADPGGGSTSPGRTRPTLAILPRGHYYGGKSKRAYSFPALVTVDGLQRLIDLALQQLATAMGVPSLSRDRLILTAHSGGVAALLKILRHVDPHEVHVFDGLYQDAGPLIQWATRRARRDQGAIAQGTARLRAPTCRSRVGRCACCTAAEPPGSAARSCAHWIPFSRVIRRCGAGIARSARPSVI